MGKVIKCVFKSETLSLHETTTGFYLWDDVVGMNIAMNSKTEQEAFIEALLYYQNRLSVVSAKYKTLQNKVDSFLCQFEQEE